MRQIYHSEIEVIACKAKSDSNFIYHSNVKNHIDSEIQALIERLEREGYQDIRAITWEEWCVLEAEALKSEYKVDQVQFIDAETFKEKFNLLQPWGHEYGHECEIFFAPECIFGRVYTFYIRLGANEQAKHYSINTDRRTHYSTLVEKCREAEAAQQLNGWVA